MENHAKKKLSLLVTNKKSTDLMFLYILIKLSYSFKNIDCKKSILFLQYWIKKLQSTSRIILN